MTIGPNLGSQLAGVEGTQVRSQPDNENMLRPPSHANRTSLRAVSSGFSPDSTQLEAKADQTPAGAVGDPHPSSLPGRSTFFQGLLAGIVSKIGFGITLGAAMTVQAIAADAPNARRSECMGDVKISQQVNAAAQRPLGEEARALALHALRHRAPPQDPYVQFHAEVKKRLELLGLIKVSRDHIHISDVDLEHGGAVVRTAAGIHPLAKSVSTTLSVELAPVEFARANLTPDQFLRYEKLRHEDHQRHGRAVHDREPPDFHLDSEIETLVSDLEFTVLEKKLQLQMVREQRASLPGVNRIFVNMSWGQSADRLASDFTRMLMNSEPGTAAHQLVTKALGERLAQLPDDGRDYVDHDEDPCRATTPPEHDDFEDEKELTDAEEAAFAAEEAHFDRLLAKRQAQALKLKRKFVYPQMKKFMKTETFQGRMASARRALEVEVAKARRENILLFEAAGNEFASAAAAGDPEMSRSGSSGVRGILRIGAAELGRLGVTDDDQIASFSAAGDITLSADGTKIPVWLEMGELTPTEGTSFSSPESVRTTAGAAANQPHATADEVAQTLDQAASVHDLTETVRDGAGVLSPFSAVIIAANPKATKADIDAAWKKLGEPGVDVNAIRLSLGLVVPAGK